MAYPHVTSSCTLTALQSLICANCSHWKKRTWSSQFWNLYEKLLVCTPKLYRLHPYWLKQSTHIHQSPHHKHSPRKCPAWTTVYPVSLPTDQELCKLRFALQRCSPTKFSLWHASAALGSPPTIYFVLNYFSKPCHPWPPGRLLASWPSPLWQPVTLLLLQLPLQACKYLTPWSLCALLAFQQPLGHTANKDF